MKYLLVYKPDCVLILCGASRVLVLGLERWFSS